MKKKYFIFLLTSTLLFSSCDLIFNVATTVLDQALSAGSTTSGFVKPSPGDSNTIKGRAFNKAAYYVNQNTRYELGKMGRAVIPFDCSGLITRCYEEALKGTNYKLPYAYNSGSHASAQTIYDKYSTHITVPEKGDLIFLNFARNSQRVTHIGIYVDRLKTGEIRFIDASDYSGYDRVVDYRKIDKYDKAIIGFGEMKFVRK